MQKKRCTFLFLIFYVLICISGCGIDPGGVLKDASSYIQDIENEDDIQFWDILLDECNVAYNDESGDCSEYEAAGAWQDTFQPAYPGQAYIVLNGNVPNFTESDYNTEPFETYSELDHLGRCGEAFANVGIETMPTEERGNIGMIKPSGWHTVKYDIVDGKYLYNRCHLIGYQLTGENANEKNLITGTRYMNVEGMLPFENTVADYILETGNHVLYRVTPVYDAADLVAKGVEMEASSVEDRGASLSFHVFVYNIQPGISINYATGESMLE